MPVQHDDPHAASPFTRYMLAMGRPPQGARLRGWVAFFSGADDVPKAELVKRYGDQLRRECRAAGFEPACDLVLRKQSAAAREAAERWAAAVIQEGKY